MIIFTDEFRALCSKGKSYFFYLFGYCVGFLMACGLYEGWFN